MTGNPRLLIQSLFSLPYAITTYPEHGIYIAALVFGLTLLAVKTGHGNGMDLGDVDRGEPERLEFLILWIKPHIPLYWYDAGLLAITGLAVTLPAGIATLNPLLALSGLLKAPAYMIAKWGDTKTEGGELLTGAFLWGAI